MYLKTLFRNKMLCFHIIQVVASKEKGFEKESKRPINKAMVEKESSKGNIN